MQIPPWDWLPYFAAPKVTAIGLVTGVQATVVTANPNRVLLAFSAIYGAVGNQVALTPLTNSGTGFIININCPNIIFTSSEHGPLPSLQWKATAGGTAPTGFFVTEVILNEWPSKGGFSDYERAISAAIQRQRGNK